MEINPYQSPPEQPPRRRNVVLWIVIVIIAISIPFCGCYVWPTLVDLFRWFAP